MRQPVTGSASLGRSRPPGRRGKDREGAESRCTARGLIRKSSREPAISEKFKSPSDELGQAISSATASIPVPRVIWRADASRELGRSGRPWRH